MSRGGRIAAVTLGLAVAGALFGGAAGAVALAAVNLMRHGLQGGFDPQILGGVAMVGAGLGAVLLPAAGWLLMRQVPIGKALLGTTVGTLLGAWAGSAAPDVALPVPSPILGALAGFALATVYLRIRATRRAPEPVRVA